VIVDIAVQTLDLNVVGVRWFAEKMEEKVEEKEAVQVLEKKEYKRCRMREHYTCIDTQVSLKKSDVVDVIDSQQEKMWLVRHSVDTHKVIDLHVVWLR